jgi:two-component system, chemotaxis family, chemotaxis protein CheY
MPRVLVADDAPMVEGFMQEALKSAGLEVAGVAKTGQQAVDLFAKIRPDLVTLDLNMPVMNGRDALKAILALDPSAKVIVITAMNQPLLRKDLMAEGAREVLGKPIRLESLLNTVRDVLESPNGEKVRR